MNEHIVPEHRDFRQLDPNVLLIVGLSVLGLGLILLGVLMWNWNSWGHVVMIVAGSIVGIIGMWKAFAVVHDRSLHHISTRHQHKDHISRRELGERALDMYYSVAFEYPDGHKMTLTSPLTIPGAPVTIKEINLGNGQLQIVAPLALPDKSLLIDTMRKWNLTPQNIFLGLGKGGKEIACSLEGLMHVAHDAPTGQGKTAQWMAEIVQLLKLGIQVILCNPHFAPVGKKGEDWRPIGQAIESQGWIEIEPGLGIPGLIRKHKNIAGILKWLAHKEIDRRFTLQAQGDYSYKPLYIFIDEWPSVVQRFPEAGDYLVDVLQRGRAVEVNIDTNAQGFLMDDVGLKGSARENFSTAYHMGGSVHSGAKLLDLPVKDYNEIMRREQVTLGKGIALLRNNESVAQAELVRLPLAENMYTYYMLGRADNWMLPEFRPRNVSGNFRNEDVSGNLSDDFRNGGKSDEEPVYTNVSEFRKPVQPEHEIEVEPETRNEIIRLRTQGFNRTEIRDIMHFNGEQFKIIKQVLDKESL